MDIKEEMVCRLCLQYVKNDYGLIDETTKEMLHLLLRMDLTVSKDPILCEDCMSIIRRLYRFKESCLRSVEMPETSFFGEDGIKEEEIIVKVEEDVDIVVHENVYLCQFCKDVNQTNCVSSDIFDDPKVLEQLIAFIPEKRSSCTKNSIMCITCKDDLECYLKFMQESYETEEKIKAYRDEFNITDIVKLIDLKAYIEESNTFQYEYSSELHNDIEIHNEVAVKKETCGNDGDSYALEKLELDSNENYFYTTKSGKKFQCTTCLDKFKTRRGLRHHELHVHNIARSKKSVIEGETCQTCGYIGKNQYFQNHLLTHGYSSTGKTFKCSNCPFETTLKADLFRHLIVHKDILNLTVHKCTLCPFESINRKTLDSHMLTHKNKDEIETFKCNVCSYETIHRHYFYKHSHTQKTRVKLEKYKCNVCEYETKKKSTLENHMLSHTTEEGAYNCDKCPYKTMLKQYYMSHMLYHLDSSEIELHKCPSCPFETRYRRCLMAHKMSHVNISEKVTYKCPICSCVTLRRSTLKRHIRMVHADKSEVQMFKCASCSFETRYKCYLRIHVTSHMKPREKEVLKCFNCSYETMKKCDLRRHMSSHRTNITVKREVHKCGSCKYWARSKVNLRKHQNKCNK